MTKERNNEAYRIFRRIAISNNKNCDELNELNALKRLTSRTSPSGREDLNSVSPIKTTLDEVTTSSGGLAHEETEEIENEKVNQTKKSLKFGSKRDKRSLFSKRIQYISFHTKLQRSNNHF